MQLIIFDCDGVLVDSEIIANRIDAQIFTDLGYPISAEESIRKFTGMDSKTVAETLFREKGIVLPHNLAEITTQRVLAAFEKELRPLILDVLSHPVLLNFKKCVASSSPRARVLRSLQLTGQDPFFKPEHVFTSAQVQRGKPAPDLFLFAAENRGVHPADCLVIEDSLAGIQAAHAAQMPVVAFLGGSHAQADWYKKSLEKQELFAVAHTAAEVLLAITRFGKKSSV